MMSKTRSVCELFLGWAVIRNNRNARDDEINAKHSLSKYKSEEYNTDNIFLIYGTDNPVQDVKAVYHQGFDEAF